MTLYFLLELNTKISSHTQQLLVMILVSVLELRTSQQIILLRRGTLINMELSACHGTRKKTTVRKMANIMEKIGAPNLILGATST